jgi:hypothetical protein
VVFAGNWHSRLLTIINSRPEIRKRLLESNPCSPVRWACLPGGALKTSTLTQPCVAFTLISPVMPSVWPAPCVAYSIKAFMTDKSANGGTWTSSNTRPGCTPRCHAWPAVVAARQHRHRSLGRARAVVSLHCLKRWLCLCAGSCPCAKPLHCTDKQLWRRIEHYVDEARTLDDMSAVRVIGIDETSLRKGQNYIAVVHDLELFLDATMHLRPLLRLIPH